MQNYREPSLRNSNCHHNLRVREKESCSQAEEFLRACQNSLVVTTVLCLSFLSVVQTSENALRCGFWFFPALALEQQHAKASAAAVQAAHRRTSHTVNRPNYHTAVPISLAAGSHLTTTREVTKCSSPPSVASHLLHPFNLAEESKTRTCLHSSHTINL